MQLHPRKGKGSYVQRQLMELGFPLVGVPDTPAPRPMPVFNGQSVRFGPKAERNGITAEGMTKLVLSTLKDHVLKNKRPAFVVLVPRDPQEDASGFVVGETVFPVAGTELIRYQHVLVHRRQVRSLGDCEDGQFFEADADDLICWDGNPPARRTA